MIRIKTLSLPLVSAMVASTVASVDAQVVFQVSSDKTYRQTNKEVVFKNGGFSSRLSDGQVVSIFGCDDPNYFPPGFFTGQCAPGTSGFVTSGTIGGATIQRPYLVLTGLTPAVVVEPKQPDLVSLVAAPASALPRPAGGFADESASVYYNLHTTDIREYDITSYTQARTYTQAQRGKFESEIVPGAYRYSFPRLNNPLLPAPITAVIYPMPEGFGKVNNQKTGVQFTQVNNNRWTKDGFVELSYSRPNRFTWRGITPSSVFASVDKLYFSLRALRNPSDPKNSDVIRGSAVFPAFETGVENASRVQMRNPFVTTFVTPPVLPTGTSAVAELEIERDFKTGGVTYDFSTRRFQIPVTVVDRFTEYAKFDLATAKFKNLLADPDRDGFNNMTEWILESNGADSSSVPQMPLPAPFQAVTVTGNPTPLGSYFGFNVDIKQGTIPKVDYTLQRSTNNGRTWRPFRSDNNWTVDRVTINERGTLTTQIQVRSLAMVPLAEQTIANPNWFIQPPGTFTHQYRVKITLRK